MTLIPIEHARRLASAAEAEAFYDALGAREVSVRGLQSSDPARLARLVGAVQTKREHTVSFLGGALGLDARAALEPFVTSPYQYFDFRTTDADLRIWPELRCWVHSSKDRHALAALLGAPVSIGESVVSDARVTIHPDGSAWPIHVETKSIPDALRLFLGLSGDVVDRGFVNGLREETKPALLRFLHALGTRGEGVLVLDLAGARELTELYAGETLDWQHDGLLVDFPDGRVHGFLTTPRVEARDRDAWQARVTKALARAGL